MVEKPFAPWIRVPELLSIQHLAFARMVSWKYAQMAAPQVEEDLRQHHGRKSSRSMLRDLADVVASIAQAKEDKWEYDIPELSKPVATVAIGLDGANLLYYEGYRIAMCGTISLYDDEGERLHLKHEEGAAQKIRKELDQACAGKNKGRQCC